MLNQGTFINKKYNKLMLGGIWGGLAYAINLMTDSIISGNTLGEVSLQARAIECGFSVLRNPVNGNIILYDYYGRPLHMANAMNVHTGILYLDIPQEGELNHDK